LTFKGPCIVIYSYNESQRDAVFLRFIDKVLYLSEICRVLYQINLRNSASRWLSLKDLEKRVTRREKDRAKYTLLYCRNLQGKGIWNLPHLPTAINREVFFRLCQRHYFTYFLQSFSIIFTLFLYYLVDCC
jgi:hypothetical protein